MMEEQERHGHCYEIPAQGTKLWDPAAPSGAHTVTHTWSLPPSARRGRREAREEHFRARPNVLGDLRPGFLQAERTVWVSVTEGIRQKGLRRQKGKRSC